MPPELDILTPNPGPALSATSDYPTIVEPVAPDPAPEPEAAESQAPEPAAEAAEAGPAEEPAAQPRRGIGERLSTYAERARAAEERANRLEKMLETTLEKLGTPRPETPPSPAPPPVPEPAVVEALPPRPRRDQFDDPDAYDAAIDDWNGARTKREIAVALAEREQHEKSQRDVAAQEAARKTQETRIAEARTAYAERRTAAEAEFPDYAEIVDDPTLPISEVMARAIMEAEEGPKIAYHLGKNRDIATRIASLTVPGQFYPQGHPLAGQPLPDVQRQLWEMGKLAATFVAPATPAPPPAKPPSAPAPITPVRRSNGPAIDRDPGEMSMEEYAAQRMPKLRAERRSTMFGGGTQH